MKCKWCGKPIYNVGGNSDKREWLHKPATKVGFSNWLCIVDKMSAGIFATPDYSFSDYFKTL